MKKFSFFLLTLLLGVNIPLHLVKADNWVELVKYSGSGSIFGSTSSFTINFDEWRIKWEYTPLSPVGDQNDFDFWVIPEEKRIEGEFDPTTSIAGVYNPITQNGTIYISDITGAFFLHFAPESSEWTVIVEQNIESIPEFPLWILLPLLLSSALIVLVVRTKLKKWV